MHGDLKILREKIRSEFGRVYGYRLDKILLFGSRARGDDLPDSDIDMLVVLKGDVQAGDEVIKVSPITSKLSLDHDVVVSCVFMSQTRYLNENSPLLLNIRREGVML